MKRLLLDTCIYGEMILDKELTALKETHNSEVQMYGFILIRRELRATSPTKRYLGKNVRVAMLSLYDQFVGEKNLLVDESTLMLTAKKYFDTYRQLGGHLSEKELQTDYLIVACAAHKSMDVVASNDHASMLSELSLKAYSIVNDALKLKNPHFIDYAQFKLLLLGGTLR